MEGRIEKLDDLGRGILYDNGKITFIPKTIPGDYIEYNIIKSKKNYNEGILIKVISQSEFFIKPLCPYFSSCGGCDLQNLSYKDTIKYKSEKIINGFKRIGTTIKPKVIVNPKNYGYRNKISLKVVDGKIGFYEFASHKIVEIDNCVIAFPIINKVISVLKKFNIKNGEIIIRTNKNEEILLILKTLDNINIEIDWLKQVCKLTGIILNDKVLYGDSFLYEMINETLYRISYDSFFQVNPFVAEELFKIIENEINVGDTVLDIYCGVGTLSLSAAKKALSVVGIEIVPNAVLNAIFNAKINKLDNVNFILNDASNAVLKINKRFNKVIVDPPRSGLSKNVIDVIMKMEPEELIYVSCDPQTLLRDFRVLQEKYQIKNFYILDMFSYTYHVECVCVLKLK